jgi:hypothetical protein
MILEISYGAIILAIMRMNKPNKYLLLTLEIFFQLNSFLFTPINSKMHPFRIFIWKLSKMKMSNNSLLWETIENLYFCIAIEWNNKKMSYFQLIYSGKNYPLGLEYPLWLFVLKERVHDLHNACKLFVLMSVKFQYFLDVSFVY